eukprot:comp20147_c0_seq1/m.24916 comp20147_c0_seq1/g.24916  ORF comp20147_c0_seq1/g.24916 comp20147_c0_seq1/m.24916 type:complete len:197 (-) comp20147_c0_seq1:93-683(-)
MFGMIISGRLVQANPQQADATHFLFPVESPDSVSHVVVFMTGQVAFPEGLGGAVYLNWNDAWQFLGVVTNEKPSAIFKISSAKPKAETVVANPFGGFTEVLAPVAAGHAQIGISVEPLQNILSQTPAGQDLAASQSMSTAEKLLGNLYNYLTSFAQAPHQLSANEQYIPISAVQGWYSNLQRKLQMNPRYLQDMPQ